MSSPLSKFVPVTWLMRRVTRWTSSSMKQPGKLHQHWNDVRTGLSWSPASERSKCGLHTRWKAAASAGVTKSCSSTTWIVVLVVVVVVDRSSIVAVVVVVVVVVVGVVVVVVVVVVV